jgi:hypothetical protein
MAKSDLTEKILKNICIKAYVAGLIPTIKNLKEQLHAEDPEPRCDVPDRATAEQSY